ncbi:hypothetical protein BV898_14323 [Hypsibius exemplaris]|uniref:Uncharacterized protein n=1 Tax=Hypsibius exemplaris TaxID=2072580 RepID=A0A9X6NBN3_HYPEX|nr:hypothetical protein BV898_14323 [Hypsibius exemplaris]
MANHFIALMFLIGSVAVLWVDAQDAPNLAGLQSNSSIQTSELRDLLVRKGKGKGHSGSGSGSGSKEKHNHAHGKPGGGNPDPHHLPPPVQSVGTAPHGLPPGGAQINGQFSGQFAAQGSSQFNGQNNHGHAGTQATGQIGLQGNGLFGQQGFNQAGFQQQVGAQGNGQQGAFASGQFGSQGNGNTQFGGQFNGQSQALCPCQVANFVPAQFGAQNGGAFFGAQQTVSGQFDVHANGQFGTQTNRQEKLNQDKVPRPATVAPVATSKKPVTLGAPAKKTSSN